MLALRRFARSAACAGLSLGAILTVAPDAAACDAKNPQQYASAKTVWCVDPTVWAQHQNELKPFFAYGDAVVDKLTMLFAVTPKNLPFTIQAATPDGSAQTPSDYGPGVKVTGDAFYGSAGGVNGFWGYLLVLHEFINQWTGLVTGGWPNDWWADHRSPFPNSMDWHVMADLGKTLGNNDLLKASDFQKSRFDTPGSSDFDAEVGMFDGIFALPNYGFAGFSRIFGYLQADGMSWDSLRDPPNYQQQTPFISGNPSELLADHVIAYLSLGAGKDLTASIASAGVGPKPPQWPQGLAYTPYAPNAATVGAIADAHCALAAVKAQIAADAKGGKDTTAEQNAFNGAMGNFRKGDYGHTKVSGVAAACGAVCPTECGCDGPKNTCVAPWHSVDNPPMGMGGSGGSSAGSSAAGGAAGTKSSAGGAAGSSGTAGSAGAKSTGGSSAGIGGNAAAGSGSGGKAGAPIGAGGATTTGGHAGVGGHAGSTVTTGGAGAVGGAGGTGGLVPVSDAPADEASSGGCGCRMDSHAESRLGIVAAFGLLAACARRRRPAGAVTRKPRSDA